MRYNCYCVVLQNSTATATSSRLIGSQYIKTSESWQNPKYFMRPNEHSFIRNNVLNLDFLHSLAPQATLFAGAGSWQTLPPRWWLSVWPPRVKGDFLPRPCSSLLQGPAVHITTLLCWQVTQNNRRCPKRASSHWLRAANIAEHGINWAVGVLREISSGGQCLFLCWDAEGGRKREDKKLSCLGLRTNQEVLRITRCASMASWKQEHQ